MHKLTLSKIKSPANHAHPDDNSAASQRLIRLGLSEAFHNKTLRRGYTDRAYGNSFIPTTITLEALCTHILAGKAWTPGCFSGTSRKNETFQFAELIALDADDGLSVAQALQNPVIRQYALLVHPSASSSPELHKTRVVFVLSERVQGTERYRALVTGLVRELHLTIDPASLKPAQFYYGSTNQVEAPYINLDAVLPVDLLGKLTYDAALDEMLRALAPNPPTFTPSPEVAERKGAEIVDRTLGLLASARPGERHDTLVRQALKLFGMQKGGWPVGDIEEDLRHTARRVMGDDRGPEIERALQWAEANAAPYTMELPAVQRRRGIITRTAPPRSPAPAGAGQAHPPEAAPTAADQQQGALPAELHLWQIARFMICCPEYILLDLHARTMGSVSAFTAAQIAASAGVSPDTAQRWINAALEWGAVSQRSAELKTYEDIDPISIFKNAERQTPRGAAVARQYCLTPDQALPFITSQLPDRVQDLLERGEPGVINQAEARSTGLDESTAALLEMITEEVCHTVDADEVSAKAERAAVQKADQIAQWAELDETPFQPDRLPKRVSELRTMLIDTLIATQLHKRWRHNELKWVAGVKRGSVSALMKKSKFVPSPKPTFHDVSLRSGNPHRAVRALCSQEGGVPTAWLDDNGKVIGEFSPVIPPNAAGVRLNVGKTYIPRDQAEAVVEREQPDPPDWSYVPDTDWDEDIERPQQKQTRRRAHRDMSALRGCMEARGWWFIPGPFGYWTRGDLVQPNSWDGMVKALLMDDVWARKQREERQRGDGDVPEGTDPWRRSLGI